MGRETGSLHLLAPLLLTGGKGADLVIRGNVVLNTLSARSTSTLLRDRICINSSSSRQVLRPSRTVLRDRLDFRFGSRNTVWNPRSTTIQSEKKRIVFSLNSAALRPWSTAPNSTQWSCICHAQSDSSRHPMLPVRSASCPVTTSCMIASNVNMSVSRRRLLDHRISLKLKKRLSPRSLYVTYRRRWRP
jgi:hypothetical protein